MTATIERQEQVTAWELRTAWAKHRPVVLSLSDRCCIRRIKGTVEFVAESGAFVICDGWHVPTVDILAVARPHHSQRA